MPGRTPYTDFRRSLGEVGVPDLDLARLLVVPATCRFVASEASIHWQNTKPGAVHWLSVGTNKSKQFRSQDSVTMCHVTPRVTSLSCVRAAVFCPPLSSRSFRINTDRHVFCSQLFRQLCRSLKRTSLSDMPTS